MAEVQFASGMCIMLAGLGVWVVAFYLPYAWFSLTFNYSYGQEPGFVAGMTFSMVVVAGNASCLTAAHCALSCNAFGLSDSAACQEKFLDVQLRH